MNLLNDLTVFITDSKAPVMVLLKKKKEHKRKYFILPVIIFYRSIDLNLFQPTFTSTYCTVVDTMIKK